MFLDACEYLGQHADQYRGVVFIDPHDGAEVRWNPAQRATKKVKVSYGHTIEARLPGREIRFGQQRRFVPAPSSKVGDFSVNSRELAQLVAPCFVHMLDSYFNALVLEYLRDRGVANIVAVHDGWFVPAYIDSARTGREVLTDAIADVGRPWLSGLGRLYNGLASSLKGSPHEHFTKVIRQG